MSFASVSTTPATKPITIATSRLMNVRRYTDSAKIESSSYTSEPTAELGHYPGAPGY
jgi:hypothetical protein